MIQGRLARGDHRPKYLPIIADIILVKAHDSYIPPGARAPGHKKETAPADL